MGLHSNPDEIAFRFHWAGMAENDPAPLKLRRTGSSWLQEDPPSLKLRRDKHLMAENDKCKKLKASIEIAGNSAFEAVGFHSSMRCLKTSPILRLPWIMPKIKMLGLASW